MPTYNQLCKKKRLQKTKLNKTPALEKCPQKKGFIVRFILKTPKKPNSALRKLVRMQLRTLKTVYAYIPGEGHSLKNYNNVLIRGGRVKDLPGLKYHLVRGKLDLYGVKDRKSSRSKYGTKHFTKYL